MAYPLFHEHGPASVPLALNAEDFSHAFPCEGDHVEFKQGVPEAKIAEAVTAFSNSNGGVLLMGVTDRGVVAGLEITGETEAKVHRAVRSVHDPGRYEINRLEIDQKTLLVLAVHQRREGFSQMQDGRTLVRRGAMNVPLIGAELAAFVSSHALARFETTDAHVARGQADDALVASVQEVFGWSDADVDRRLFECGLLTRPDRAANLTVAGLLYLTTRPGEVLGKAHVEIFRYRQSSTYDRRIQLDGPLQHQVESTVTELINELGSDVVVLGVRRHELPRIPAAVLREAVANAVAHRTYETSSQAVRIELWPDRLVITSPGGLPEPVTLATMREQSAPRNIKIINVLRRFRMAEDAGMGVDLMEDEMEAALLERPQFTSDGSFVSVELPLGSTVTPRERAWVAEIEQRGQIQPRDRALLLHAARGEVLTNSSVRELLSLDSTHARAALVRLRDLGYLVQAGARGGATYSLARTLNPPPGLQLDQTQLVEAVTALEDEGVRITNEEVRGRTGLDRARVLQLLNGLVHAGVLERHGERRGSYYTVRRAEAQ